MQNINTFDFNKKKALIRVDFNVPLNEKFEVTDDTRISATIPTIKKVLEGGGIAVLMSHLGRPDGIVKDKYSLKHILPTLHELLGGKHKVYFANDCIGEHAKFTLDMLRPGEVLVLENLRFYKEEEEGDTAFAKKLSRLGDVYINDAFGTAHRAHASTSVIAENFDSDHKMFGLLMEAEVSNAERVLKNAAKPFTAIIGGAKVSDKILLIENLLERASDIIIGGGMAYTFIKARGGQIGKSLCEEDKQDVALTILKKATEKGVSIHLPETSVIAEKFSNDGPTQEVPSDQIPEGFMGLDIGGKAIGIFSEIIKRSKTILWNGPMGVFEMSKFQKGTKAIALAVADATTIGAYSLVGGGDSVAAINKFGFADDVSFVSTGGGALLEFFEGKELPGVKSILG